MSNVGVPAGSSVTAKKENKKSLWEKWKHAATKAATSLARVLLNAFYWVFVTPFALIVRTSTDPLQIKSSQGGIWEGIESTDSRWQH